MYKKFELNRTKIKGAITCQSEGGQVLLVFSLLYIRQFFEKYKKSTLEGQSVLLGSRFIQKKPL